MLKEQWIDREVLENEWKSQRIWIGREEKERGSRMTTIIKEQAFPSLRRDHTQSPVSIYFKQWRPWSPTANPGLSVPSARIVRLLRSLGSSLLLVCATSRAQIVPSNKRSWRGKLAFGHLFEADPPVISESR